MLTIALDGFVIGRHDDSWKQQRYRRWIEERVRDLLHAGKPALDWINVAIVVWILPVP